MASSPLFGGSSMSDGLIDRLIGAEYENVKIVAEYIPQFPALLEALEVTGDFAAFQTALATAVASASGSAANAAASLAAVAAIQTALAPLHAQAVAAAATAGQHKDAAAGSATAAGTAKTLTDISRDQASTASGKAQQWATKTDGEVEAGQGYGAKKYAQDAAAAVSTVDTKLTQAQNAAAAAEGFRDQTQAIAEFDVTGIELISRKAQAGGYPSLDGSGKIPTNQLPAAVFGGMNYQGTWNASTNSPAIPASAAENKGFYYKVSTAGSTTISGISDWNVGDWIVSSGAGWDKVDNTDLVSSVAGLVGVITALALKSALGLVKADVGLGNVDNTSDINKPVSSAVAAAFLLKSSNLSDLTDPAAARTNLGMSNVENKTSATIRSELTSSNVIVALGLTPIAGINFGMVTTALGFTPANAASLTNVENKSSATIRGEITSGNVTSALTFTPMNPANYGNVENKSSAMIRGELTSGNVTTALAFTPMNAASYGSVENKSSATIRGELTSGNVTGALGYTPMNNTRITYGTGSAPALGVGEVYLRHSA